MYNFSDSSLQNLMEAHPLLVKLFLEVIKHADCTVTDGHRVKEKQNELYPKFTKLRWPNSMHNKIPSLAVDVMPFPIDYYDTPRIEEFALLVNDIADFMGIPLVWGGDWINFVDRPHYQLKGSVKDLNRLYFEMSKSPPINTKD